MEGEGSVGYQEQLRGIQDVVMLIFFFFLREKNGMNGYIEYFKSDDNFFLKEKE